VSAAILGGTYFYLQGESPVNVVCATKDIPSKSVIKQESVEEITIKKRDVPDSMKSDADSNCRVTPNQYGSAAVYAMSEKDVVGRTSGGISKGQMIFKGGRIGCDGDLKGFYLGGSRHHHIE